MKTERQWQRLWERYCEQNKNEHPQTRDFIAARKLLLTYTGHGSRYHVWEWPDFFTSVARFFSGSWNKHHGDEVTDSLKKHVGDTENCQKLISTEDNYDHIPLEKKGEKPETTNSPYLRKWLHVGTHGHRPEDFDKFDEAIRAGCIEGDILKLADETQYQFQTQKSGSLIHTFGEGRTAWSIKIQSIQRREQVYDLLTQLQINLINKSINPNGDLAKILRVISKNTGHSIAVAYDDFLSFKHYGSMVKDLVDTFKPYKYKEYDFKRDLKQPLDGFINLVKGIISLIGIPLIVVRNILSLVFNSRSHDGSWYSLGEDMLNNLALIVTEPLSYLIDGGFSLIRGATQIVTTPLLIFKIPLRCFLGDSKLEETIEVKIQNSKKIQEMFNKLDQNSNKDEARELKSQLVSEIDRKFGKGWHRGGSTSTHKTLFFNTKYLQDTIKDLSEDEINNVQEEYLNHFRAR